MQSRIANALRLSQRGGQRARQIIWDKTSIGTAGLGNNGD